MEWYGFIKWLIIGCLIYWSTHGKNTNGQSSKSSQKPSSQGLSRKEQRNKQKFEDFFK